MTGIYAALRSLPLISKPEIGEDVYLVLRRLISTEAEVTST